MNRRVVESYFFHGSGFSLDPPEKEQHDHPYEGAQHVHLGTPVAALEILEHGFVVYQEQKQEFLGDLADFSEEQEQGQEHD